MVGLFADKAGVGLMHQVFDGFLGELGDMTFFLTVIFAAWCPLMGMRRAGPGIACQQALVAAGAVVALTCRLLMMRVGWGMLWHASFASLTALLVFAMGLKAHMELGRLSDASKPILPAQKADLPTNVQWATPSTFWHRTDDTRAEDTGDEADNANEGYGSIPPAQLASANGPDLADVLCACILPFIVIFVAEANDRSASFEGVAGRLGPILLLGRALGGALATAVAVSLGFVLERQCDDRRILSALSLSCFGMALLSLSQGLQPLTGVASTAASHAALQVQSAGIKFLEIVGARR